QADLGEFARIKSQVWRNARALAAEDIFGIESAVISVNPFAAKTGDPARFEAPKQLRIEAPVTQSLRRKPDCNVFTGLKPFIERLGLQRDKRKTSIRVSGFPLPVKVRAIDLSVASVAG